jgi:ABC-2 type transport system permease protein
MRATLALLRREFQLYFISPVGYVVLAVFFFATALTWYGSLLNFVETARRAGAGLGAETPIDMHARLMTPYFFNLSFMGLFLLPLLTMRLMAEERRQGSVELLLTYPITDLQVILGKYLAAVAFYGLMILGTAWTVVVLVLFGNPDPGPILAGYLGVFLYGAALIALGLMLSSLTENQIVAAVLSFVLFLLLWILQWGATVTTGFVARFLDYASVVGHFKPLSQGVVDTRDIVFFLTLAVFGLSVAHQALTARRWNGDT